MKTQNVKLPSNRRFGFIFSFIFLVFGIYFFWNESKIYSYLLLALSIGFFLVTSINDKLLGPLNKAWMKLGVLLGMIVSPIVLGVIYFGLFTPIALFMKCFGRDELRLKIKTRSSQWRLRESDETKLGSFSDQF